MWICIRKKFLLIDLSIPVLPYNLHSILAVNVTLYYCLASRVTNIIWRGLRTKRLHFEWQSSCRTNSAKIELSLLV